MCGMSTKNRSYARHVLAEIPRDRVDFFFVVIAVTDRRQSVVNVSLSHREIFERDMCVNCSRVTIIFALSWWQIDIAGREALEKPCARQALYLSY